MTVCSVHNQEINSRVHELIGSLLSIRTYTYRSAND
jgi:hypothetical protein